MVAAVAAWVGKAVGGALLAAGASAGVAHAASIAAYAVTTAGLYLAPSVLQSALTSVPDIETGKGSLRQAIPPRIRAYGRCRIGGYYMLWTSRANYAYDVVALHHGLAEAIEKVWSHDKELTIAGDGWVQYSPEYGAGGLNDLIHIQWRLGLATETAYPALVAALGSSGVWTNDHRGDGIASLGIDYHHAKKENLLADFPSGDPRWAATGRWSRIWDPRVAGQDRNDPLKPGFLHTASENTALQIMDFLCHPDGMGMDYETEIAPALNHWKGEADICDEPVTLAAGGSEKRYTSALFYPLPGDRQDTLNKLLAACNGRLTRDALGITRLWVGKLRTPTVWLTDADIADYEIDGDAAAYDVCNEIVASHISEAAKWSMAEVTPWRNETDIEARGEVLSLALALEAVKSATQARRLAKRESRRQLTSLRGVLIGRLSCIRAMGERWVGVDIPDLGLEQVVIELEAGGRTAFSARTVSLPFSLADMTVDDWNPALEEGGAGDVPTPPPPEGVDPPTVDAVSVFADLVAVGVEGLRLHVEGTGPDRDDLTWSIRWRVTGSTGWTTGEATDDASGAAFEGDSGFVVADADLDVQLGFVTGGGGALWSATFAVNTASPAPLPATLLEVHAGVSGEAVVGWRNSTSGNFDRARVWTASLGTPFGSAVDVSGEVYGAPGAVQSFSISDLLPGNHDVWVTCEDADGLASAPVGPVTVTIA